MVKLLRRRRRTARLSVRVKVSPISLAIIAVLVFCFFLKLHKVLRHHSKTLKPLFPKPGTENLRIRPLGCARFLKNVRGGRSVKDPNRGELIMARTTDTFSVSLFSRMVDSHLRGWSVLETGTYYPKKATALFRQLLHNITNPEESRVIDVGASFGWFSLLARKYNVKVDVFEPNLVNVIRICESIEENKWNNRGFDIYPYGLTEEDGTLLFQYHEDGTARANENWGHKSQAFALDSFARERGWLERNDEDIRILKVDVGNHVPQVLAGASELLSSGMVKSLILDLRIRHKGDKESCMQAIQQIMNAGFELQMYGDELGPASKSPWKHDTELPRNIIEAMEKAEHNWEMTFWWKRKDS